MVTVQEGISVGGSIDSDGEEEGDQRETKKVGQHGRERKDGEGVWIREGRGEARLWGGVGVVLVLVMQ